MPVQEGTLDYSQYSDEQLRAWIEQSRAAPTQQQAPAPSGGGFAQQFAHSLITGFGEIVPSTIDFVGLVADLVDLGEKEDAHAYAEKVRGFIREIVPPVEGREDEFWASTFPSAVGSMGSFLVPGMGATRLASGAGKAAQLAARLGTPATLGAMQEGAGQFYAAQEHGASEEDAWTAFALGMGVGATEAVPIGNMLNRANRGSGGVLYRAFINGTEELIQEGSQTVASNAIAQNLYDEDRKLIEGAVEGGAAGFLTGFLYSALLGAAGRRLPPREREGPQPEGTASVQAQVDAFNEGRIPAFLLPEGSAEPEGLTGEFTKATVEGEGVLYLKGEEARQLYEETLNEGGSLSDVMGSILGYGLATKPEAPTHVLASRDAQGRLVRGVLVDEADTPPEALSAAQTAAGEGGAVETLTVEESAELLQERAGERATVKTASLADTAAIARVLGPDVREVQAPRGAERASGFAQERGRRLAFVERADGSPLPTPGFINPATGTLFVDANAKPAEQLWSVVAHEMQHALKTEDPEVWQAQVERIRTAAPEAIEEFARQYAENYQAAFGKPLPENLLEDEGVAFLTENLGGFLSFAAQNPGVLEVVGRDRSLVEKLVDAIVRALQRLGIRLKDSSTRKLNQLRDDIAQTDFEKTADPEVLRSLTGIVSEALNTTAGQPVPAPVMLLQRAPKAAPPKAKPKKAKAAPKPPKKGTAKPTQKPVTPGTKPTGKKLTSKQARRQRQKANRLRGQGDAQRALGFEEEAVSTEARIPKVERGARTRRPDISRAQAATEAFEEGEDVRFAVAPPEDSPEFKRWFGDSKVVDAEGKPLVVYTGTKRPDRVGAKMDPKRATSGPLIFTTDDPELASSYAQGKEDTSLEPPADYAEWFGYKPKGARSYYPIDRAWYSLSDEERAAILGRYHRVTNRDEETGERIPQVRLLPEGDAAVASREHWRYVMQREASGNPLRAMVEVWLSSGELFGTEQDFMPLLEAAGLDMSRARFQSPHLEYPAVYPLYLSIQRALDTAAIPEYVVGLLREASKRKRGRRGPGSDPWDKRHISGAEWVQRLDGDLESGSTHAWTSIPDWVTNTLRDAGYDGIRDTGGKMGGTAHTVWIPFNSEQVKSAIGNRGTFDPTNPDIRFAVRDQAKAALSGGRAFIRKNLTSMGNLPRAAFQAKLARDGAANSEIKEMTHSLRDFEAAVKVAYPERPGEADVEQIDAALHDAKLIRQLPAPLRQPVRKMRQHIDTLSRRMIDSGLIEEQMRARYGDTKVQAEAAERLTEHVKKNIGLYVTRSYRVYDDPDWADKVPEEIKEKARALIRKEHSDLTEAQVHGMIDSLLYVGKAAESPLAIIARSKLGAKDLSILKPRTLISPEFRALYGEYRDARVNYARSVTKMAHLIANHQFLRDVKREGVGRWLFEKPETREDGKYVVPIAAEASSVMFPLNGLHTTAEINEAFIEAVTAEQIPAWLQYYMRVNSSVKFAKTIGSVMTHVRNTIGNTGFAVANGHWKFWEAGTAIKGASTSFALSERGLKDKAKWRRYFRRAVEIGVVHEDARAGELRDMLADAAKVGPTEFLDNSIVGRLKRGINKLTDVYQAEDDVWKLYAWENEKARYRKAHPEWSEQRLEEFAANIVRNTYPTYSLVPRSIKKLRRFPLVGNFVSFPWEVIRVSGNTMRLAAQEVRSENPEVRKIGWSRVAGMSIAATGTSAAAMASRFFVGLTDEDDDDARLFMAPWDRNADILWLGMDDDGNRTWVNLSYTDPYSYLKKPIMAFMRGEDFDNAILESGMELLEPFFGEEILASKIIDVRRNTKPTGGSVYNPEAPWQEIVLDVGEHVGDAFLPGTIVSLERIRKGLTGYVEPYGRDYDAKLEALAMTTGHRINKLDIEQSLSFRASDYSRSQSRVTSGLSSVAGRRGTVTEAELRDAYEQAEMSRRSLFSDLNRVVNAAMALGLPREDVQRVVRGSLSEDKTRAVMDGTYKPYKPSSSFLRSRARGAKPEVHRMFEERRKFLQALAKENAR